MGRAYGNIGNAYSSAGLYEQAIKYHKQELIISKEVHDRSAEASTHGMIRKSLIFGNYNYKLIYYYFCRKSRVLLSSNWSPRHGPYSLQKPFEYC